MLYTKNYMWTGLRRTIRQPQDSLGLEPLKLLSGPRQKFRQLRNTIGKQENAKELSPLDSSYAGFCIPATSAESERTFSLAGLLVSPARTRLSPQRLNDLLLLRRHLTRESETSPGRSSDAVMSKPNHGI